MNPHLTDRQKYVLAALATEAGVQYAPVQVQKLFFLLDENVADAIGGKQFTFEPYDYGPFDKDVYRELDDLERLGLAVVAHVDPMAGGRRRYGLTAKGHELGQKYLDEMPAVVIDYIAHVSKWVRSLSFAQLVGSIYKAYPRMRENSIFRD